MIEAVIFDIDGTLVDSVDLHAAAWQEIFLAYGHALEYEDVRRQIGKGGDQLIPVFLSNQEVREYGAQLEKQRGELYKRDYLPRVRAFPKVRELFQRIKDDGRRIALASSAKGDELATYKRLANIAELVEGETSADEVEHSKPYPDIFAAALESLGLPAKEAIAVGDTPYDAQAARRLGLPIIGLLCGGFPQEELRAAGCSAIYTDPADLLARYDESPLGRRVRVA